jgi:Ni,Fe-hydrogenase maturation factor
MRNISPKSSSRRTEYLQEDCLSTDGLDRIESFCVKEIPGQENHFDHKMAIISVDNSPQGDGGICQAILKDLMNSPGFPTCIDIIDCSRGGVLKATLSQSYQYAWILDTADLGLSPGKWLCFKLTNLICHIGDRKSQMTMHYADISEALALGIALDMDLPYVEIYCIQPLALAESECINALREKIVLEVCDSILFSLKRRLIENGEDFSR